MQAFISSALDYCNSFQYWPFYNPFSKQQSDFSKANIIASLPYCTSCRISITFRMKSIGWASSEPTYHLIPISFCYSIYIFHSVYYTEILSFTEGILLFHSYNPSKCCSLCLEQSPYYSSMAWLMSPGASRFRLLVPSLEKLSLTPSLI